MLLHADEFEIAEIKKAVRAALPGISSSHASEAIAAGLGFKTNHALIAALGAVNIIRPISDVAFIARLQGISSVEVTDQPLTAAAIRARPLALAGQNHDEGILAAVAEEIATERTRHHDTPIAFSLNIEHLGGNEFSAEVAFREDYDMTVMIHNGDDDEAVAKLFMGDLDAIEGMLSGYDTDWITNYTAPDDEGLIQGRPIYDPRIVAFGVTAQVWRGAVAISHFDSIGNFERRDVVSIDEAAFERIGDALHSIGQWVGNADAIQVIQDIANKPTSNMSTVAP